MESRAFSLLGYRMDLPLMVLDDLFDKGEADPRTLMAPGSAQALEDNEYLVPVPGAETDTVVGNGDLKIGRSRIQRCVFFDFVLAQLPRRNLHYRSNTLPRKFDRIADKVVEQLGHLQGYGLQNGKRAYF